MKLATLNQGRDGVLVVVSRDLAQAVKVPQIAATLQAALDDWNYCKPKLEAVYQRLNDGLEEGAFAFDQTARATAPLPRAYHWADGSAYVNHVELVRKARGAEMPESFWHDPLMYQGGADAFIPPHSPIRLADEAWGIDLEGELAVITDDVPMGATPAEAAAHIQLLMLVNDVSLRNLIPGELAKGFGFYQSKPSSSFSPVAVTPDELGETWRDGNAHRPLVSHINGELFGQPDAGTDMTFSFPTLVAHAARTRPLGPAPSSARARCRTTIAVPARPAWPRSACSRSSSMARRRRRSSSSATGAHRDVRRRRAEHLRCHRSAG